MLSEIIKHNRSYRRFHEEIEIPHETLVDFINNTRFAPTARNQQILVYKPITDKKTRDEIFTTLKWAGYLKNWDGPAKGEQPTAYIVIGVHKNRLKFNDEWVNADLGIACQTILLQAAETGFGGCIIAAINKPNLKEILSIPEHIEPKIVIALGKPVLNVELKEIGLEGDIKYYSEEEKHIVPKRKLEDILF